MATEAVESVIFSFGILFVEDAFNYVFQHASSFHNCMTKGRKQNNLPRKSIIRKIGVHLTWIKVQRFHIVWREGFYGKSSECEENELSKSVCQCSDSQTLKDETVTPWERKIEDLEKEMFDLRSEVAKLLLLQESRISVMAQEGSCAPTESDVSSSTRVIIPFRPPPPPPPLPPTPLALKKQPLVKVKVKAKVPSLSAKDSTSSIMEELAKCPPKLRHVERSPGGRPVRLPLESNNPADKLAAILRKRFEAIHSPTRDPYMISPMSSPKSPELFGH